MTIGLNIEVCGSWAWISGTTTKDHKEILKNSGFKWHRVKKMWFYHPKENKRRYYKGETSMDDIRSTYGSQKVNTKYRYALA